MVIKLVNFCFAHCSCSFLALLTQFLTIFLGNFFRLSKAHSESRRNVHPTACSGHSSQMISSMYTITMLYFQWGAPLKKEKERGKLIFLNFHSAPGQPQNAGALPQCRQERLCLCKHTCPIKKSKNQPRGYFLCLLEHLTVAGDRRPLVAVLLVQLPQGHVHTGTALLARNALQLL